VILGFQYLRPRDNFEAYLMLEAYFDVSLLYLAEEKNVAK